MGMSDGAAARSASVQAHARWLSGMFYPKSDIQAPPEVLKALREAPASHWGIDEALAARLSPGAVWRSNPAQGTFHAVFTCDARQAPQGRGVMRISKLTRALDGAGVGMPAGFVDWQMHADSLVAHHLALHHISPAGAIVPVVNCNSADGSPDWELLAPAPGTSLAALDDDEPAIQQALAELARGMARIHAVTGEGCGYLDLRDWILAGQPQLRGLADDWPGWITLRLDEHLALLREHRVLDDPACTRLRDLFAARHWREQAAAGVMPGGWRLLHGDAGNHNAFIDAAGEVTLIDWEDALLGDPRFDLAYWASFHPPRRWPAFWQAYFGKSWEPDGVFWVYFLRVALSKTVHRLRFGIADRPGRPPASGRIMQAMDALAHVGWLRAST